MAEPCSSSGKISAIDERTKQHAEAIVGFRSALDTTNKVLAKISQALSDIRHLHEDQGRNERDIDELFGRVRTLELAPGKSLSKLAWSMLAALSGCVGGVVTGVCVWLVTKG